MAALSLGMLGFVLSLMGMECTFIGGKDRSKYKKIYAGGWCHVISENKINDLARKMEKQFADRVVKKPAGGVSILPERKDEIQELTYTDLEESSEWMVSSLEERLEVSKPEVSNMRPAGQKRPSRGSNPALRV
uniref:Uncharacterized protein n=1 Tax=Amphiprion ocellaris TaxID=80972 RepID=A0AAQ5YMT2_AMPOC